MSYFGEQIGFLMKRYPDADPNAIVDAVSVGVEAFSWMKDGTIYVGTCGTRLRDAREELEAVRITFAASKVEG